MFNTSKEATAPATRKSSKGQSVLGPTLTFKGGELSSDEDLVIEGTVEGQITHHSHKLTVGKTGKVKADVHARIITIEGTIEGNLQGDEAVHIGRTGRVIGNVTSPRISIEDGATFEGRLKTTKEFAATKPGAKLDQVPSSEFAGSEGVRDSSTAERKRVQLFMPSDSSSGL